MNSLDKQYTDLLDTILEYGSIKKDRTGTGTCSIFGYTIRHDMSKGFPLLTTKKMYWKGVVTELLWFLRGDSNIRFLVENGCNIWNGDAYKNYLKIVESNSGIIPVSREKFVELVRNDVDWAKSYGELGPIYGRQWRNWGEWYTVGKKREVIRPGIDQISKLIEELKTNPDSRRLMVNAWNVSELERMVLPPCHYGFQVYTRELTHKERYRIWFSNNYETGMEYDEMQEPDFENDHYDSTPTRAISLMWNQRSVDVFLGLPFNIASYGLLLEILAKTVNMVPDQLVGNLGDTHLYLNHFDQAKEQIGRKLTAEERIDLCSKEKNFDPFDFGVGDISDLQIHKVCDSYGVPKRTREPFKLPKLVHLKTTDFYKTLGADFSLINHLDPDDFEVTGYKSHPGIKADLSN